MGIVRVAAYGVSMDGYGAGPDQSLEHPLGRRGPEMMGWFMATRTFRAMQGLEGGSNDVDERFAERAKANLGAWILGRNMFGPVRGPWPDLSWRGWWGDEPPYHVPVFVLTHHPREPLEMAGGTTFHFITEGPAVALACAREAAGDRDVRIGGGAATIRQYLAANAIDEMHLAQSPVLLGRGEPLFDGIDLPALGFQIAEQAFSSRAMHVVLKRPAST